MDTPDWISACVARLHQQWPTVDKADLAEVALELADQPKWRQQSPQEAAARWLRQGIPSVA